MILTDPLRGYHKVKFEGKIIAEEETSPQKEFGWVEFMKDKITKSHVFQNNVD